MRCVTSQACVNRSQICVETNSPRRAFIKWFRNKHIMVLSKEMPWKTLPKILLLDLRRKGIHVPPEIQIRIMYFKERQEIREGKEAVMREIRDLQLCHRLQMPQYCGQQEWKSAYERPKNEREPEPVPFCHWCSKVFRELLPIGARAELCRPVPHLGRLYAECSWLAMELYHQRILREPLGTQLRNGNRRSPELTTVESIMRWMTVTTAVVDFMIHLNRFEQ